MGHGSAPFPLHLKSLVQHALVLPAPDSLPALQITSIANLFACTSLTDLNLSCNSITDCQPLAECPSLQTVSLPWNAISSLEGLDALPVLRRLDLRGNRVRQLVQVALLASLPNLEELLLARNPITCVPGWRISVLACFLETVRSPPRLPVANSMHLYCRSALLSHRCLPCHVGCCLPSRMLLCPLL